MDGVSTDPDLEEASPSLSVTTWSTVTSPDKKSTASGLSVPIVEMDMFVEMMEHFVCQNKFDILHYNLSIYYS